MNRICLLIFNFRVLTLFACLSLLSCQNDLFEIIPGDSLSTEPGLNLSVSNLNQSEEVSTHSDLPGTRAVVTDPAILRGTDIERTAKILDIFLFDEHDAMLGYTKIFANEDGTIGGGNAILPNTGSGTKSNIDITQLINEGGFGSRRLAVVANWDSERMGMDLYERTELLGNSLGTLERTIINPLFKVSEGNQVVPYSSSGLIMYGKSELVTVERPGPPAFNVQLERMVARLDLNLSVSGVMASAGAVAEVRIMQAANMAFLAPPVVADGMSTMPSETTQRYTAKGLFASSPIGEDAASFSRSIYLPENNLRVGTYSPENATYILVNIPLNGTDNWYRFWVNEADNRIEGTHNYHIKRNTIYQITAVINAVGGPTLANPVDTNDTHFGDAYYTLNYDVVPNITGSVPPIQRYRSGETITVPDLVHSEGIYPVLFNTRSDETGGTIYRAGDTFVITQNTTLYARLRPAAPRITIATGDDGKPMLDITYDPRDAGLLFKYGSIVGVYSDVGGRNAILPNYPPANTPFNAATDVAYNPMGVAIGSYTDIPFVGKVGDIADWRLHSPANIKASKGDPCRLVGLSQADIALGTIDNGVWRMPTTEENMALVDGANGRDGSNALWSSATSPWGVSGVEYPRRNNVAMEDFLPTYKRKGADGFEDSGTNFYRSTSGVALYAPENLYYTIALNTRVYEPWMGWTEWIGVDYATSIRCVRQGVPRITIEMDSGGQPMLALTDNPKDGGLLFKYGSTVGVYSGHNANLTASNKWKTDTWDSGDVAFNYTTYPSSSITNANMILPAPDNIKAITADFHSQSVGRLEGLGDPCRLVGLTMTEIKNGTRVDNGMWRLPNRDEVAEMMGGMDWDPASCTWGSQVTSPWEIEGFELKGRNRIFKNFIPPGGLRSSVGNCTFEYAGLDGRLHYWLANSPRLFSLRHKAIVWENEDVTGSSNRGYMTGRICVRQKPGE